MDYLRESFPDAQFSTLCNYAVALNRLTPGRALTLGLGRDGTPATRPREGAVGLDLKVAPTGGPWDEGALERVYMGIPMSALPALLRFGPRPSLRLTDLKRLKKFREQNPNRAFALPNRSYPKVIYVSRKLNTAAGYPWALHGQGWMGELALADGSRPMLCVLKGSRPRFDARQRHTARWEKRDGSNDQIALPHSGFAGKQ